MIVEVYSDGSATTKDLPGGWAYVIVVDGVKESEGSGHIDKATNNIAEITAAIEGLSAVLASARLRGGDRITLVSDSQLVLKFATGEYQCRKYHLVPYYIKLRKVFGDLHAGTRWVKGHAGDEHNERCDELAKGARSTPLPSSTGTKGLTILGQGDV